MVRKPVERYFLRFQKYGRPEDLAVVFDATGAELLRVASHLARDLHEAEDLVQNAFLAAIQHRSQYERKGDVLAWLLGILVNLAREQRRAGARRPDPEKVSRALPVDPSEVAAAQEISRAVSDAIARLPDPYRPVLNFHLRHGLSATEIALSLGRPAATVRSQLARGLGLLRRALPTGLALGLACVTPVRGLSAVRAAVLGQARNNAVGVAAVAGGALLMKKWIVLVVAALGALVWWEFGSGEKPVSPVGSSTDSGPPRLVAASASREPSVLSGRADQAGSDQRVPLPPMDPESGLTVIRGRCVAAENGSPLAGCTVRLVGRDRGETPDGSAVWTDPEPVVTGLDGAFSFEFAPLEDLSLSLAIDAEGRVRTSGGWGPLRGGVAVDLEDVPMLAGAQVLLRIVEDDGRPVAGVQLSLEHRDGLLPVHPIVGLNNHRAGGTSDEDGLLAGLILRPGWWNVEPADPAGGVFEPRWLEVPAHGSPVELTVVRPRPDPEDTISGHVLTGSGRPVAGLEIRAFRSGRRSFQPAVTDRDGFFYFARLSREASTFHLELDALDRRYELVEPGKSFVIGAKDLELIVRAIPEVSMDFRVVVSETGEPVEEFGYRAYLDPAHYGRVRDLGAVNPAEHRGGRATVDNLRKGHYLLSVFPSGHVFVPMRAIPFEVGDVPPEPMTVELRAPVSLLVTVLRRNGEPVEGTRVELVHYAGKRPLDLRTHAEQLEAHEDLGTDRWAALRGWGVTDDRGRVRFRASPHEVLAVRVMGPGHLPRLVEDIKLQAGASVLEVAVDDGATIHGRLSTRELARRHGRPGDTERHSIQRQLERGRFPEASLSAIAGTPPSAPITSPVQEDGSFLFDDVPPGSFEVRVHLTIPGSSTARRFTIGEVRDLEAGETRNVEFARDDLVPGRVSGLILYGGEPHAKGEAFFLNPGTDSVDVRADAHGRFAGVELWPGRYLPGVTLPVKGALFSGPRTLGTDVIEVFPGAAMDLVVQVPRHVFRIRLIEMDGTAAGRRQVRLRPLAHGLSATTYDARTTDEDGWVVFDPAPPFPSEVLVYQGKESFAVGSVLMPLGETESEWEFRLDR